MIFNACFTVQAQAQEVWDFLIDIPRMGVCLPGMQKVEQAGEQRYNGLVEVKLGAARVAFQGSMVITQAQPPNRMAAQIEGWEVSSASRVTGWLDSTLDPAGADQTQVQVCLDLNLEGRLSRFDQPALQPVFEQTIEAFMACMRRRIERPAPGALPEAPSGAPGPVARALRGWWAQIKARIQAL